MFYITLPDRIKQLRLSGKMTLNRVSSLTGLSVSFLSDIERGRSDPSLRTLYRLAKLHQMTVQDLIAPVIFEDDEGVIMSDDHDKQANTDGQPTALRGVIRAALYHMRDKCLDDPVDFDQVMEAVVTAVQTTEVKWR